MNKFYQFKWKKHKVHVSSFIRQAITLIGDKYLGAGCNDIGMTLEVKADIDQEKIAAVDQLWSALTEQSEAAKFARDGKKIEAVQAAKASIPYASLGSLIPAEKKILLNTELTEEDFDTLIEKYGL